MNALGETMAVRHPVDFEILHRDQVKLIDNATTLLVSEVAPPPARAFMHPRYDSSALGALWRSLLLFAGAALYFGERPFLGTKEAWVGDHLPVTQGGEGREAHVNSHLLPGDSQRRWFDAFTGETDVPLARAAPTDGRSLGRPFNGAVQENLHLSNIGDTDALFLSLKATTDWNLREGDAVVTTRAAKARISWRLACSYPTKVRLKRQIKTDSDILQHLRVDPSQYWTHGLERGQGRLLVIQTQRLPPLLPRIATFGQQVVVQPATFLKLLTEQTLLLFGGVQSVLEHFTHAIIANLRHACCQAKRPSPLFSKLRLLAVFCEA
jgi:hypothetical protein